jgi:drug/metabolite transporter (DMT)-like permease
MIFSGVITGLGMAFFQSCSYLGSRYFYSRTQGGGFHLLAVSHIQMGILSAVLLWLILPAVPLPWDRLWLPVALNSLAYMTGQAFFLLALKESNPSQVASLLALKLILISLGSLIVLGLSVSLLQAAGIALSMAAVLLLHSSKDRIAPKGLIFSLLAVAGYSVSDLLITVIVRQLDQAQITDPAFTGTCLVYICNGLIGLCMLPFLRDCFKKPGLWLYALPFALTWYIAINLIFQTFLVLGPVFGNILQSTRGLISVVLGKLVLLFGIKGLEESMPRHAFLRRLGAAILMTASVSLFVIST